MKIKNVSPFGDLDLPLIGRVVAAGEVFEVSDEDGALLVEQPAHWKHSKPVAVKKSVAPTVESGETK
jgi:hypothetical protein